MRELSTSQNDQVQRYLDKFSAECIVWLSSTAFVDSSGAQSSKLSDEVYSCVETHRARFNLTLAANESPTLRLVDDLISKGIEVTGILQTGGRCSATVVCTEVAYLVIREEWHESFSRYFDKLKVRSGPLPIGTASLLAARRK